MPQYFLAIDDKRNIPISEIRKNINRGFKKYCRKLPASAASLTPDIIMSMLGANMGGIYHSTAHSFVLDIPEDELMIWRMANNFGNKIIGVWCAPLEAYEFCWLLSSGWPLDQIPKCHCYDGGDEDEIMEVYNRHKDRIDELIEKERQECGIPPNNPLPLKNKARLIG